MVVVRDGGEREEDGGVEDDAWHNNFLKYDN